MIRKIRQKVRIRKNLPSPGQVCHHARQQQPAQFLADLRRDIAGQHGAPALSQHEFGRVRQLLFHQSEQRKLVFGVIFERLGAGVTQAVRQIACLAMADVVVRVDGEARFRESQRHVQIAAGVLAVAVDQLDDGLRSS